MPVAGIGTNRRGRQGIGSKMNTNERFSPKIDSEICHEGTASQQTFATQARKKRDESTEAHVFSTACAQAKTKTTRKSNTNIDEEAHGEERENYFRVKDFSTLFLLPPLIPLLLPSHLGRWVLSGGSRHAQLRKRGVKRDLLLIYK